MLTRVNNPQIDARNTSAQNKPKVWQNKSAVQLWNVNRMLTMLTSTTFGGKKKESSTNPESLKLSCKQESYKVLTLC
jgi:hypothetical protein